MVSSGAQLYTLVAFSVVLARAGLNPVASSVKTERRIPSPSAPQTDSALETRRVPQVSLLRPGILLGKASRVHPKGQEKAFSQPV